MDTISAASMPSRSAMKNAAPIHEHPSSRPIRSTGNPMEEVGFTSRSFATERRRTRPGKGASDASVTIEAPVTSRVSDQPKRLFLLDGHSLSYRAFFALPTSLQTTTGQITNAVYGFTSMLIKLLTEEKPDLIAVAFDIGAPTVRLEKYAEYKAGRAEAPGEFREQLGLIVEVLETLRIPVLGIERHEAYDVDAVTARYGLPPEKYRDFVALKGDPSDNIPGVPGVGDKTATKLVQDFGSVEQLLERTDELKGKLKEAIEAAGEQLRLNKELAELDTSLELEVRPEECVMGEWDLEAVRRLFTSLEFRTLFERLEEVGRSTKPAFEMSELDLRETTAEEVATLVSSDAPKAVRLRIDDGRIGGIAVSAGGGQAAYAPVAKWNDASAALASAAPKWAHDAKDA